ncbi:MAG: histidine kinase [Bacteroidota bacterium]
MSSHTAFLSWLYRYKLYHIPFWFVYHYVWWSISSGSPLKAADNIFFSPYTFKFLFYVLFQAIGVYVNLYYLLPKFLEKGKYTAYLVSVLLTILVTSFLIIPGYYVSAWWNGIPFEELFGMPANSFMHFVKTNSLPSTVASMTLAMSIKLGKNWLESQRRAQILEKEKLETELKFLKAQFNPHFLFNTINSIFVLIHKNPDRASESLAKFSHLMRYQLYECNAPQIPLDQELLYLENFIELEELRMESDFELSVYFPTPLSSEAKSMMIAPFILMPFVENAFKHVSQSPEQVNWITIRLTLRENILSFHVGNSRSSLEKNAHDILQAGGLGLKNVQRRLDLLYPQKHNLDIVDQTDRFEITLALNLEAVSEAPLVVN